MNSVLNPRLVPRNGRILRVLVIARISTVYQDKRSLDDQIAKVKEYLGPVYSGQIDWTIIKAQGGGDHLGNKALHEAEDLEQRLLSQPRPQPTTMHKEVQS